ncbi:MAG: hypothetical protein JXM70_20085 [Pirellulales bacterium]|nr:hypothetical protein [Pirellulales bacterium]
MPREVIERSAADNEYMHKDFHGALSAGLDYIAEHYGEDAVREYLHDFGTSYYAPLKKELVERGLVAVKEYYAKIYEAESAEFEISMSDDELRIDVAACPAVMHMRKKNYKVSPLFVETTRTVNEAICEGTPFVFELVEYDEKTGKSVQRFYRRSK